MRLAEVGIACLGIERGLHGPSRLDEPANRSDPLAAIRSLSGVADPQGTTLLVLPNFHRFLNSAEIVQALLRQFFVGKQIRTFVVVLSPVVDIPVELAKLFVVLNHELPDREQLAELAHSVATEPGELPADDEFGRVLDAAAGLTRYEAEGAFSLSLVREGRIQPETLWELKSQTLKKNGLLHLHRGEDSFNDLGGLSALKEFCLRTMRRQGDANPLKRPKGVLLLSPPGCGKSSFVKCLGQETGRPTIILDVGALYGGLVGETERNIRAALATIDAMAPAIVLLDEVEKALAGATGKGDAGVSSRLFGTLLTYLADRQTDVFVAATCNEIASLPPEFSRAGRFDAIFFIDLPSAEEKSAIWEICLRLFDLDPAQPRPNDESLTGAEIHSCCRLAALLDVPLVDAAEYVVPISQTSAESIETLRQWASGRCLSADRPGLYQYAASSDRKRRQIPRDPSVN